MTGQSLNVDQGVRPPGEPVLTARKHLRADIQALRGLAILLVVVHHARIPGVPGGFLGVDIFFVISGYLMTGLIDEALSDARFTLKSFYVRRIRRLFPAAYATLAVTAIAAPFLLDSAEYGDFVAQLAGAFTFTVNFVLWRQTDYFGSGALLKPLLHTWSLSIEEQFYLFLPLLMMGLPRKLRLPVVLLLTLASAAACILFLARSPSGVFYLLPFRAWELGIGSAVALLVRRDLVPQRRFVALRLPAVAVLVAVPALFDEAGHPGWPALAVCLATALLLVPGVGGPRLSRALRPITWIGDRSYSLYLVHWPVFAFASNVFLTRVPLSLNLLLLVLVVVWTELQYRLVEQPLRRFAIDPRSVLLMLAVPLVVIGGSYAWSRHIAVGAVDRKANKGLSDACEYSGTFTPRAACRTGGAPEILIWGDSFGMHLAPGIVASTDTPVMQATRTVCGPFLGLAPIDDAQHPIGWARSCDAFNRSVADYMAHTPSIKTVVLSSPLTQYIPGAEENDYRMLVGEGSAERRIDQDPEQLAEALRRTVAAIHAAGKRAVFVAPLPAIEEDMARCLDRKRLALPTVTSHARCDFSLAEYRRLNAPVRRFLDLVAARGIVPILSMDDALCAGGTCRTTIDGVALYRDHHHLSISGSRLLGQRMHWGQRMEQAAR